MKVLVTGSAGFIGFHVARALLAKGHSVVGLDAFTDYYDVSLKRRRHALLEVHEKFRAEAFRLEETGRLASLFADCQPDIVIHLAAQAGVRYCLEAPETYITSNLLGTFSLLEACKKHQPDHCLIASTSSAYGANTEMPFTEVDRTVHPLTLYASTKAATELMAHSQALLLEMPTTVIRFFTVYGPWGRPDMALFKWTKAMLAGEQIDVYNHGKMVRDFTYIDDVVRAVLGLMPMAPKLGDPVVAEGVTDSLSPVAPWRLVNIGSNRPIELNDYISAIETALGIRASRNMMGMQFGDVPATTADIGLLRALIGPYVPTSIEDGVAAFVNWYLSYYVDTSVRAVAAQNSTV